MFPEEITQLSGAVIRAARSRGLRVGAVETVTGGLVTAALTAVPGASETVDRGYVLYGYGAKTGGLGVPPEIAKQHGAVSAELTRALAEAFFSHGDADASIAVTGYAGPGGGSPGKPVGTVFLAAARRGGATMEERWQLEGDRDAVRAAATRAALVLLAKQLA